MKRFRVDIPLGTLVLQFDAEDAAAAEKIINSIEAEIHPPPGGIEWQEVGYDASGEISGASGSKPKPSKQISSILDTAPPVSEDDLRARRENEELRQQLQEAMGRK